MKSFIWILKPDMTDIDLDDLYNYSCYDDKCLISTFFIDEIFNFLNDNNIKVVNYTLSSKFQYKLLLDLSTDKFNEIFNDLINFKTGRFKTSSIHIINK